MLHGIIELNFVKDLGKSSIISSIIELARYDIHPDTLYYSMEIF